MFLAILLLVLLVALGYFAYFWRAEKALRLRWTPDPESVLFSQRPLPPPLERLSITQYELPLSTAGRHVVDAKGRRFKLASINWYGASDELFIPGGLDVQHRSVLAHTIKKLGFNSVRLPYADELVMRNPVILPHLVIANPDLAGLQALDVFEAVVTALTDAGIAVIVNNHITSATWCCGADPCDAGWANDHLLGLCRVRQTEDEWIDHWETVMERFIDNPYVIGADLRNEVRGLWGTMPWSKWAAAAERCGNRLLAMKRDWLIVVEGTESANDVSGALTRPIELDVAHKLVYSAHIYGWSGWGELDGRFSQRSYASFVKTMRRNWGYLVEGDIAPVWVGEFGAPDHPSVGNMNYWRNMFRYLKAVDADFGYWALNPRKPANDSRESYSLVKDDWVTPVLDYRMKDIVELTRQ
jgi:endoglucanase